MLKITFNFYIFCENKSTFVHLISLIGLIAVLVIILTFFSLKASMKFKSYIIL